MRWQKNEEHKKTGPAELRGRLGQARTLTNAPIYYRARAGTLSRLPGGCGRLMGSYRVIKIERYPTGERGAGENEGRLSESGDNAHRISLPGVFPCKRSLFYFQDLRGKP